MPMDSNGVPFNGSYIVATGNLASDMYANITAESGGRLLATRLYEMTDDAGMKDMLAYLIARDTMHQNQWVAILKDLGDSENPFDVHPVPDSFPQGSENQEFNYDFMSTNPEAETDPGEAWTTGESPDGKGELSFINQIELDGQEISIPTPDPSTYNDPESAADR
jgi:Mn-containing catalase